MTETIDPINLVRIIAKEIEPQAERKEFFSINRARHNGNFRYGFKINELIFIADIRGSRFSYRNRENSWWFDNRVKNISNDGIFHRNPKINYPNPRILYEMLQ